MTAACASNRLTSRRSVSKDSNLSICEIRSSALRATVGSKLSLVAKITCEAIRIVVRGVRSSCETSETNRCCSFDKFSSLEICCCSETAISLNEYPKLAISSSPWKSIRRSRFPLVSSSATLAAS